MVESFLAAGEQSDRDAFARERIRNAATKSLTAAEDECRFAFKTQIHVPPPSPDS
jgi:hypothetical protein